MHQGGREFEYKTGPRSVYRFAGKHGYVSDWDTKMLLLGARYYIPQLGRFLTQDPIGQAGGLNLYNYCDNNPLAKVDPDGMQGRDTASLINSYLGPVNPGTLHRSLLDFLGSGAKVGIEATNWTSFFDPSPVSDLINGILNVAVGQRSDASLSFLAALLPEVNGGMLKAGSTAIKEVRYAERIGVRWSNGGSAHRFPYSFDPIIMQHGTFSLGEDGYAQFSHRGFMNGKAGTFELGGRVSQSGFDVNHRFFRPDRGRL